MKKIAYLSMLLIALTLMSFSCSKDDDEIVPTTITAADLVGDWNFQSLDWNLVAASSFKNTTTSCDVTQNSNFDMITLNLMVASNGKVDMTYNCPDDDSAIGLTININGDEIDLSACKFKIMNVSTFNKTILKLKLIEVTNATSGYPINGIYTLAKKP